MRGKIIFTKKHLEEIIYEKLNIGCDLPDDYYQVSVEHLLDRLITKLIKEKGRFSHKNIHLHNIPETFTINIGSNQMYNFDDEVYI